MGSGGNGDLLSVLGTPLTNKPIIPRNFLDLVRSVSVVGTG